MLIIALLFIHLNFLIMFKFSKVKQHIDALHADLTNSQSPLNITEKMKIWFIAFIALLLFVRVFTDNETDKKIDEIIAVLELCINQ